MILIKKFEERLFLPIAAKVKMRIILKESSHRKEFTVCSI